MTCPSPSGGPDDSETEFSPVRMTISLPDPEAAQRLLTFLGGSLAESSFSVDCVAETDSAPCLVAIDDVTDLQLATVTFAVEEGYYDDPKDAQLSHIAAEFGCSKSAVSQRLTGVERKLVHSFVDAQGNTVG